MADSDQSLYTLRYNQITGGMEAFGGGSPTWTPLVLSGGSGSPGSPDTSIQFNNGGSFAGSPSLTWGNAFNLLSITGSAPLNGGDLFIQSADNSRFLEMYAQDNLAYISATGGIALINDGSGNSLDQSAVIEGRSTTRGLLPPRMTTVQRDAIATPSTGLLVYNTDTLALNQYTGTAWVAIGAPTPNIVIGHDISFTSSTSTTFGATSLTATITPSSATSKIRVMVTFAAFCSNPTAACLATVNRDSTDLAPNGKGFVGTNVGNPVGAGLGITLIDSPATTSPVTYTLYIKSTDGSQVYYNVDGQDQLITLEEIFS